jgi:predicted GNAT superfamily acetyltransferase
VQASDEPAGRVGKPFTEYTFNEYETRFACDRIRLARRASQRGLARVIKTPAHDPASYDGLEVRHPLGVAPINPHLTGRT